MNSTERESTYIPGTCNIGKEEVYRRKLLTGVTFFTCLLFAFLSIFLNFSQTMKLFIFFPFVIMFILVIESRSKFCVYFGWKGIYNFQKIGKFKSIEEINYIKKDRIHSLKLLSYSILLSLACTLLFYYLS